MSDATRTEGETIPLVQEELRVETRETVTGKFQVRTVSEIVEEVAEASLGEDVVEVARVALDRVLEDGVVPQVRTEGDVTIVPVLEEVLVIVKQLVLKEELRITRRRRTREVEQPVELRKQRAIVERLPLDDIGEGER